VFVFVQFRDTGPASGPAVRVGMRKAEAACNASATSADCMPRVTFLDTSGKFFTPETLAGKVVVENFWATWCGPCSQEIPDLAAAYRRFRDRDVVMLGVMTDEPTEAALAAFAKDHGINYPIVRGDADLEHAFGSPDALPTTFIYDKTGHVRYARPGTISSRELDRLLETLVAE
jgi:peroxiredoxin